MSWVDSLTTKVKQGASKVKEGFAARPFTPSETTRDNVGLYQSRLATSKGGKALLIIDPQNDFHPNGSLAVPSSEIDALNTAMLIKYGNPDEIYVTLDTHNKYHIAHQNFWRSENGRRPEPFESITLKDLDSGKWMAKNQQHQAWARKYVATLEENDKFKLTVWPDHCLLGSEGHAVYGPIWQALKIWENIQDKPKAVHYILKGTHALTEHYSALKAEVPVPGFPETEINKTFLNQLQSHDEVFVCGQALSHCVNFTVRDMVNNWDKSKIGNIKVVTDASSSVPGCEHMGDDFKKEVGSAGVELIETAVALKALREKKR